MKDKDILIKDENDTSLSNWREKEKVALELLQTVGALRFDKSVELILFRRDIYDARPSKVINDHLFATNYINKPILIENTLALANAIDRMENIAAARIDVGTLCAEWLTEGNQYNSVDDFVHDKLANFTKNGHNVPESRDVVLYGFGRIGRLAARRIINLTGKGEQLRLKAVVLRSKLKDQYEETRKRASLLQEDTVHGAFHGTIDIAADGSEMIINGNRVKMIYAGKPADIDYTDYGINNALLIDNTGVWRDKEALEGHLRPGIAQVMLTAPAKGVPNIVYGINHDEFDLDDDNVFCAASCTTNAIAPIMKIIDSKLGIVKGHIETIHAYTSDQNLLDNFHKKPRRGRGAATNMVLTSTGAAKAVTKVMPHLAGKLTGNAVRVPTPNVSLAIMNLTVNKSTSVEEIVAFLKDASLKGDLVEQIHFSNSTEYVSSQAVGMTSTSVFDAPSTIVSNDGFTITIYAWYDNEFGYTCQVVRLAKHAAKVRRMTYY